jgi:hypothetical protein
LVQGFIYSVDPFQEWCQVVQSHHLQEQIGEFQRQSAAAAQAKTMVSITVFAQERATSSC